MNELHYNPDPHAHPILHVIAIVEALHRQWLQAVVVAMHLMVAWMLARDLMVRRR